MHVPPPLERQHFQDDEHLRILPICHYIWGALTFVCSSFFIFHIWMGIQMANDPNLFRSHAGPPPLAGMGTIFATFATAVVIAGWTLGVLTILAGRSMAARKRRTFILIIAGINCLSVPFGTALGVFTIIVLTRPSVIALFDSPNPPLGLRR